MDFAATALLLFLVLDPLGNIPLFLGQLRTVPEARRRAVVWRELLIALGVLLFFFFAGAAFLHTLALDTEVVRIAGGVVLFLIALRMIFPTPDGLFGSTGAEGEPFIVPLAIPAVAGPGALGMVMLLHEAYPASSAGLLAALVVAWAASAAILLASGVLHRVLHDRGVLALERLTGLVLVMISVQMFVDGLRGIGALPA